MLRPIYTDSTSSRKFAPESQESQESQSEIGPVHVLVGLVSLTEAVGCQLDKRLGLKHRSRENCLNGLLLLLFSGPSACILSRASCFSFFFARLLRGYCAQHPYTWLPAGFHPLTWSLVFTSFNDTKLWTLFALLALAFARCDSK